MGKGIWLWSSFPCIKSVKRGQEGYGDFPGNAARFGANEASLDSYAGTLADLHRRVDAASASVQDKLSFYETCDN